MKLKLRDLVDNPNFDVNCFYDVYDCTKHTTWNEAPCIWDAWGRPPESILDMEIVYITTHNDRIIIEVK